MTALQIQKATKLFKAIRELPEDQRLEALRLEYKTTPPEGLPPTEWLRSRKMTFIFASFAITLFVIIVLVVLIFTSSSISKEAHQGELSIMLFAVIVLALIFTSSMSKQELEEIVKEINVSLDIDKQSMMELAGATIPENISKQIAEIIAAQKEVSTRGIQVAPETSYKLGRLAVYRHDYDTALDYFKQATEADPKFSKAFEAIAWLRESQAGEDLLNENYDAAIKKLNEARGAGMHTDPLDPQALAVRGFVAQLLASIDRKRHLQFQSEWQVHSQEAAELFERAVQLDPNNPSAQSGLASVYAASGDFDAAIGAYERAIKLLPDYVRAYKDLALAYEGKMQADPLHADEICKKMLQAWKKFYQLAPKDPSLSGDYILKIGQRILGLESQGPQAESSRNE